MNCGQQFGQQMAFGNGFLLQAILACNSPCVDLQHYNSMPQAKNIRRKIFRFYGGYGADGGSLPHPKNAPPGHFCPAGRKAPGTGCSNPTLQPLQSLLQK